MLLGVDLDNTLICYEGVFHRVGVSLGLVPAAVASTKQAVRDHLRARGREDDWTELQGIVYGARLDEAVPYPGVRELLSRCARAKVPVTLISHRTRQPIRGAPFDLHAAARAWLERRGLVGPEALAADRIFLEPTKAEKLARIAAAGCAAFVDDLPEILLDPGFPGGVRRILFDPDEQHAGVELERIARWDELVERLGLASP